MPILLIVMALLGALGAFLLRRGHWPRRRGTMPRCGACDYALVGNVSGRCPECGTDLAVRPVVYGERRRRPVTAALGLVLLVLALAGLVLTTVQSVRQVDWYRYRPTAWVVEDAGSASFVTAERAWTELERRRSAGAVPESIEAELTKLALREQSRPLPGPLDRELLRYLGDRQLADKLSADQQKQFFAQAVTEQLKVRPRVRAGDPVPYGLTYGSRGPGDWWVRRQVGMVTVDGRPVETGLGRSEADMGGGGGVASAVKCDTPGRHRLEVAVDYEFGRGPGSAPRHRERRVLAADFEVVADRSAGAVRMVADPALAPAIRSGVRVKNLGFPAGAGDKFQGHLEVGPLPADVAFEVLARVEGKEFPLGVIALAKGRPMGFRLHHQSLDGTGARKMTLVLRSSERVARGTVELEQAWEGELVFEDVAVTRGGNW